MNSPVRKTVCSAHGERHKFVVAGRGVNFERGRIDESTVEIIGFNLHECACGETWMKQSSSKIISEE